MLRSLYIQNYAIIRELKIDFTTGLHVITGETGAGKSIMLDALNLALGERYRSQGSEVTEKIIVEAEFDLRHLSLQALFAEEDMDYEEVSLLRREIQPSGRSRAFVNDTPASLSFLQKLSAHLIEVHQQFDQLAVRETTFQYDVLDILAGQKKEVRHFTALYHQWTGMQRDLEAKKIAAQQLQAEQDYLQYQYDELLSFQADPVEDERLGTLQTLLSRSEEVQNTLGLARQMVSEQDPSILDQLQMLSHRLSDLGTLPGIGEWAVRLDHIRTDLDDWIQTAEDLQDQLEYDPQRLAEIEERLSILFRLKKKHQVEDVPGLIVKMQEIENRLEFITQSDSEMVSMEQKIETIRAQLDTLAGQLSRQRGKTIPQLEDRISAHLQGLGMPDATLKIHFQPSDQLHERGRDEVQFLFSSNKGQAPSPLRWTASGGEISRLNLAIKSEVAGEMALPTIIFDEVDAGVSGEVARKIAQLLKKLSARHQIICITHTPQIAAAEARHYHVRKDSEGGHTYTVVETLDEGQREMAIAEMLDGNPPSEEARKNARQLMRRG